MLMIVFIHSSTLTINFKNGVLYSSSNIISFIEIFLSSGIGAFALPLFFLISGYLFFLNIDGSKEMFIKKFRKRFNTVLIPYLLWSAWGLTILFILQGIPLFKNFFYGELVVNYPIVKLLNTLFINPIPYQLWFLRDLLTIIIITPLIYWLIKYIKAAMIPILFIVWLCFNDLFFFKSLSIFFFYLGSYTSIKKIDIIQKKRHTLIFSILWLLLITIRTIFVIKYNPSFIISLLQTLSIFLGIVSVWGIYDYAMKDKIIPNKTLFNLSSFSFFIYTFHEPMMTIIKKGLFYLMGMSEFTSILIYFLSPTIVISICIFVGYLFKTFVPQFYYLITGGR